MSILKKVNLFLLASVVMLSPQGASAMGSDSDDLEGNKTPRTIEIVSDYPSSPSTSSNSTCDLEAKKTTSIPKKDLDDISARLGPIGALLKTFEDPQIGPRKKEKYKQGRGEMETFELSSPSTTMEIKAPEDFEKDLPVLLRVFYDRFMCVSRQKMSKSRLKDFNELVMSFREVEGLYLVFNPDYQIVPEEMQRRHYIKRQSSRNLMKTQPLDEEEKLTSDSHGVSPKLSRNSERRSIRFELESSPLFQKMGTEEELQSSSYNSSPVSPRFIEESSSPSQPLPTPTPSSPPFLQRRKTIIGGIPARSINENSSLPLIPLSPRLQSSSGILPSSYPAPLSSRLMNGSSIPSSHYVPIEESASSLKSPPVAPRTTEDSLSSQPLPESTLSSPPLPPRRRTIIGSPSSSPRPLPKVPTLETLQSFDSSAVMQETPSPSPLSQVSPLPEGLHRSRSLSASPSPLVRRTPLDSGKKPLSSQVNRRMAMYYTKPLILPQTETDPSEITSDKSGAPSLFAEAPER